MNTHALEDTPNGQLRNSSGAVAPEELLTRAKHSGTVLIDIRSRREFRHAHVPGSHSIPAGLLLAGEAPDGELVLIGADSRDARQLMEQLYDLGYHHRLQYLEGGFHDWVTGTNQSTSANQLWRQVLVDAQRLIAGPLLLITAATTQSLGLLAIGLGASRQVV